MCIIDTPKVGCKLNAEKNAVHMYNTHSKNEDIFSQDFWKVIDVHVWKVYSKRLKVIVFADLNQNNNKSND